MPAGPPQEPVAERAAPDPGPGRAHAPVTVTGATPAVGQATREPGADGPPSPVAGSRVASHRRKKEERGALGFLRELPVLLLVAFLLALLIKTFLVQAFYIPSESMVPTLAVGDRVLVNKVVYRLHPPNRGDVIVFADPNGSDGDRNVLSSFWHWVTEGLGVSTDPEKDFIKRVVGLPGETLEGKAGDGGACLVFVNGSALEEPYVNPVQAGNCSFGPVRVEPDSLFVMGDNRGNSSDSRYSLGQIPYDKVVGRAFVIIWPPSRAGFIRAP